VSGFVLRKIGAAAIVLLIASFLVFLGIRALPGDPALALGGEDRDPQVIAQIRHDYGLDKPLPVQYVRWLGHALRGDLGQDQRSLSVSHTIIKKLPVTFELAGLSVLIAILIGIPTGVLAAVRRGKPVDYASTAIGLIGLSVPHFWLGLMLIIVFSVDLHWLPAGDYVPISHPFANLEHMILPAIVLGTGFAAVLMRQMRSAMLESMGSDYVRTARAKGLSEWKVAGWHAFRNSLITVTTVIGLQLGALISGAVVTEQIFGIAGFGRLTIESVQQRDYTLIQGIVLVAATGYVLANLAVDILYSVLNPRIRVSGRST
jgi:peptide/nickel transport system permease protein